MWKKSCTEKFFPPLELPQRDYPREKKNLSERQMTVARPNIHSAAISEQFSGLQRPSKTKTDLLHLTLPGVSTEEQSSAIASFLCTFSALRQVSASLSSGPKQLMPPHDSSIQERLTPSHFAVLRTEEPAAGSKASGRQFRKFSNGVEEKKLIHVQPGEAVGRTSS